MEIGGGKLTLDRGFLFNMVFIIGKLVLGMEIYKGHTDGDVALLHVSTHSLIVGVIIVLGKILKITHQFGVY